MRVYVCLKIMTPKGKQNYVRHITEKARLWQKKKRKRVENERAGERNREGGSGIKWKVETKRERMRYMGIRVWCRKNKRSKKKRKHMDGRMEILSKYFYNKS